METKDNYAEFIKENSEENIEAQGARAVRELILLSALPLFKPHESLQLSQAALNVAHAVTVMKNIDLST